MRIETLFTGIDKVKETLTTQLDSFLKKPELYQALVQQSFEQTQVHTEFPYKAKHLPLVAISESGLANQFVDIRSSNLVSQIEDEATGDLIGLRYGGASTVSINVDVATLSVPQRQKLTDLIRIWFILLARDTLNREGIQVTRVDLSGTEQVAQDQDPNFVYVGKISIELWVDWYIDLPVEVLESLNINVNMQNC